MSKTELVELIAKEAGLSKADAARALDATIAGITAGLMPSQIGHSSQVNFLPQNSSMIDLLMKSLTASSRYTPYLLFG